MTQPVPDPGRTTAVWGRAFRPFFLGGALQTALVVPWWAAVWLGASHVPAWSTPMAWHGHEMLFGFVAAAIAGFILTASPVWSGGPALAGAPLAATFALWVAGRVAFAAAGWLPLWLVAIVDVAFLPVVALAVARTLRGSGQLRNYALVGVLLVLAAANAAMHAEALGLVAGVTTRALRFAVDFVIVLILVIGGRITPAFTRNAFARQGTPRPIHSRPWLDRSAVAAAIAMAIADLTVGRAPLTGVAAGVAGAAALGRLAGWQPLATRSEPLLWSLHLGAAWVAAGLLIVAVGDLGAGVPASAGLHALTAGAMGSMIIAVTTRVAIGHTGRPLALPRHVVWCYALVSSAAALRVAAPFLQADPQRIALMASAAAWSAAFALFSVRYWPILTRPRPDQQPG